MYLGVGIIYAICWKLENIDIDKMHHLLLGFHNMIRLFFSAWCLGFNLVFPCMMQLPANHPILHSFILYIEDFLFIYLYYSRDYPLCPLNFLTPIWICYCCKHNCQINTNFECKLWHKKQKKILYQHCVEWTRHSRFSHHRCIYNPLLKLHFTLKNISIKQMKRIWISTCI